MLSDSLIPKSVQEQLRHRARGAKHFKGILVVTIYTHIQPVNRILGEQLFLLRMFPVRTWTIIYDCPILKHRQNSDNLIQLHFQSHIDKKQLKLSYRDGLGSDS